MSAKPRQARLIESGLFNLFGKGTGVLISVGFLAYLSRRVGAHELGLFALVFVLQGIIGSLDGLGLFTTLIRLAPEKLGARDASSVRGMIRAALGRSLAASLVILGLALLAQGSLERLLLKEGGGGKLLPWLLLNAVALSFFDKLMLVLQSLQRFREISWITVLVSLVQRLSAIAALELGGGLAGALQAFFLSGFAASALTVWRLRDYLRAGTAPPGFARYSLPYYFQGFARFGFSQADQALVAVLFHPAQLAVYYIARRIVSVLTLSFDALLDPAVPRLAEARFGDSSAFRPRFAFVERLMTLLVTTGSFLVSANGPWLLGLVGGEGYSSSSLLLALLSFAVFGYGVFSLRSVGVYLREPPRALLALSVAVGAVNLISGVLLGRKWGLEGFAAAQSVGFVLGWILVRVRGGDWQPRSDALIGSFGAVALGGVLWAEYLIPGNPWVLLPAQAAVAGGLLALASRWFRKALLESRGPAS